MPPPTRGWPDKGHPNAASISGAPAHAGMAPDLATTIARLKGCPRPRGDGPLTTERLRKLDTVPPPTRGWPLAGATNGR